METAGSMTYDYLKGMLKDDELSKAEKEAIRKVLNLLDRTGRSIIHYNDGEEY